MSRPVKKPAAMMVPNAMPSLRLVDRPCWAAVLTLCVMLRSGTLEWPEVGRKEDGGVR